ncbi:MAG: preprotein translocase subunit YajC [Marmoricola sp.]
MPALVQLLVIIAAVLLFYRLVMRPARNQQRSMQQVQTELVAGDEVVISAGIHGIVRAVEDDRVRLEIAPGTVITVARQVVVRRTADLLPAADAAVGETTANGPAPTAADNEREE